MELQIENGVLLGVRHCVPKVELPEEIEKIGYSAFTGLKTLTEVSVPDSVTVIEGRAFEGCENLVSVRLPKYLKKLGFCAFAGCKSLRRIELPDQVKSIEENLFDGCVSLEEVKLPQDAVVLQMDVFRGCRSLKEVVLPKFLFQLDRGDFYGCESLTRVIWPPKMKIEYSNRLFDDKTMKSLLSHQCLSLDHIHERDWRKLACIIQMRWVMEGRYEKTEAPKEFKKYPGHIRMNRKVFYPEMSDDMDILEYFCKEEIIPYEEISELIQTATKENLTYVSARLLEYQNQLNQDRLLSEENDFTEFSDFGEELMEFLSLEL